MIFCHNIPVPSQTAVGTQLSGIKMTAVSTTSLLIFVVFARFQALTAKFWQVNNQRKREESFRTVPGIDCQILAGEQQKKKERTNHEPVQNYTLKSRDLEGLVFLSPEALLEIDENNRNR